jgi:hypothetical protein
VVGTLLTDNLTRFRQDLRHRLKHFGILVTVAPRHPGAST